MKKKRERRVAMLIAIMMIFMNFIITPVKAAPGDVAINEANFPDKKFRKYVSTNFDTVKDGTLSQDELNAVTEINVKEKEIENLKGIEYFTKLKKLNCNNNILTALDISKNTNLETLYCNLNKLTALDLKNNTNLETLNCSDNSLNSLDVTKNTKLKKLYCDANPLGALNVSKNTELTNINCSVNKLTTLDLSHNTELTYIDCCLNKLTTLDLSQNTKLEELRCQGNELTTLNLAKNTKLSDLYCFKNKLTALDVSKNPELTLIYCQENQLTKLDLSKNPELTYLYCQENQLTNLDLSHNSRVNYFNGYGQVYNIKVSNSTLKFDLRSLPGNFVSSMASDWVDGDVDGNTLTLDDSSITKVKYNYKVNNSDKYINVTLNVEYDNVVTVSFDNNGGAGTMNSKVLSQGSNYKLPACTFTPPAGKEFKAWKVGGVEKAVGDSIIVNADIIVKALWKDKTVTPVTYTLRASVDGGNGSVSPTNETKTAGETVTLTFTPDTGYEIDEVKVNGTATTVSGNTLTLTMDENKTVVVKFKAIETPPAPGEKVTITFDANGGEGTMADVTKDKGESFTLPACTFTPPAGKEFKAWQVDGTEKNVGNNIVLNGDIIIKAVWKDIGSVPPTPPVPPTPYTPYPWIVYPGWYYNFEPPKPREENKEIKMEMDWKIELTIGISTIDREINGVASKIKMDVAPYIRDGRTMIPLRSVAEALGFEVEWNISTRTAVLKNSNTRVEIPVDTNKIIVNGTVYTSDVKPEIKNNRTMLTIANIARALGLRDGKDIIWNSKSKMVTIYRSIIVK